VSSAAHALPARAGTDPQITARSQTGWCFAAPPCIIHSWASSWTHSHRHVSMSNQCVRTSRRHPPWPAETADGTEAARLVARAGRPAQPSAARIRLPEGAVRKVPTSVQRAYIPDTYAHRASTQELGRVLIPGDGAAGDQGLRIGLPARQRRLPDACGLSRQRLPGAMGLSRTCRLVRNCQDLWIEIFS
jgi:hypothetical protein